MKRHPVPFGEYIPFRGLLTKFISRLDQIPRDFYRGQFDSVLDLGPVRVGDVICFEVAYDGLIRDAITEGGQLLVVQTNNATYTGTGQLEQQFAISRYRAIETGRYVVVAATNGISGIIAPDGSVVVADAAAHPGGAGRAGRARRRDHAGTADRPVGRAGPVRARVGGSRRESFGSSSHSCQD